MAALQPNEEGVTMHGMQTGIQRCRNVGSDGRIRAFRGWWVDSGRYATGPIVQYMSDAFEITIIKMGFARARRVRHADTSPFLIMDMR